MPHFTHHFKEKISNREADTLFELVNSEYQNNISGYYQLPSQVDTMLENIKQYLNTYKKFLDTLRNIVIIGIGGSSLGVKAINELLYSCSPNRKPIKLYFLEHADPFVIEHTMKHITFKYTLFIVISKSGTTIETTSLFKYVINQFNLLHPTYKQHLLVITDKDSPLHRWSIKENIASFEIESNIGGRFSVLSYIGIVPLYLLGYDVAALLEGANTTKERFFSRQEDHILHKALFLTKHAQTLPINVLFSYGSAFSAFNAWYVQLWGESLGKIDKDNKRHALTPIALIGSIDQHSFLQLIVQGVLNKSVTFLSANESQSNLEIPNISLEGLEQTDFVNGASFSHLLKAQLHSTKKSIQEQGIPTDSIYLYMINEKEIGALIYYYELLTSCAGLCFGVNTYNQPGVELGKKILREDFMC